MSGIIKLETHDGSSNYLEPVRGEMYKFKLVTESHTFRQGFTNDHRMFVDPSGGPMLVVGDKIGNTGFVIKDIVFNNGIIIEVE